MYSVVGAVVIFIAIGLPLLAWILDTFNGIKILNEGERDQQLDLLDVNEPVDDEYLYMLIEEKRKTSYIKLSIGLGIVGITLIFNLFGVVETWLRT